MNREQVWREFDALPPHAQQQVVAFITFLHSQTNQEPAPVMPISTDLANEPFVGMWRDRDDLMDSSAWVRRLRASEWTRPHD